MTRRITKNGRSVYKDFSSGTVQPAKQQPGMPEIPKNDVRNQPGTSNFSYPNTGVYREIGGAPGTGSSNTGSGGNIPKATTPKVPGGPMPGQEAPSPNRFKMAPGGNLGGSVAQAATRIASNAQPRVTPNTQPRGAAAAAAPVVNDVSGKPPATTTATTTTTTPNPNAKGKDGYTNADRTKYFNINPKSLTRGTKEHNDYWNWFNSSVQNGKQTDQAKQNQYLKWSNQSEQGWWAQGKRREGAELDYRQRSAAGLLPEQVQARDPAFQAWQASMNEDQRKNAWYAAGVDPKDADTLYGANADGQLYWPDPSGNYSSFYNPPDTTTTTTTKRMNKRKPSMKSIRKEEAPPAWWTQTRNRRYDAQAQQAADAKAAADAAAKNAWQASMEEDNRKNAWWALGIDPATQPPGAIAGQNPFDANGNFLFSDRATGNDINADSAPKPKTKKPASKPASKPKTFTPYKLNSAYTMDDQGMATADYRVPKPVTQMGAKGPYTIGYTDSAPQYNEARPLGYKGPAKAYSGMPVATTFNGVPIGSMTDGMIIPKGSNWPTYSGQVDTPNTGTLKRMTKRTKKEPICENCGMPVSQCKCAGHSHKSSKKMTKGINLRALSTSLGRLMRDSKPVVRAMRRAESPIGLRRGLKDLATNVAFEVSPTGRRSARNLAAAERTMAKNPMANPYMQDFSIGDKKYHMGFDARSMKNAITRQLKKTPQLLPPILLGYGLTNGQSTTKRIRKSMSPNLGGFIESTEYKMTATPGKKPKISVSHTDTPIISKRATGPKPNKYFQ